MSYLDNSGVSYLWSKIKAAFAAKSHNHTVGDITSGTLPIARGGTGVTTNPSMLTNLSSTVADTVFEATPRPGVTGTLPIARGGTAGTTKTEARQSLEVPVNSSIAPIESITATANHAIGDYFMLGDVLMVATSAIATGETINTSNAMTATIQSQIDAIRDSLVYTKTINNWRLTQYPDGTVTAYTWWQIDNIGAFVQWGNLYNAKVLNPVTYPITFSELPTVRLELYGTSSAVSSLYLYGEGTRTVSPQVWAIRPDAAPAGHHLGLGMYINGRAPSIR